jgi:O-antigen/teichoic acid export membrane protein
MLVSCGRTFVRTAIQLAMPVISIGLCFILVPRFGAMGAALATLTSHGVLAAASWAAAAIVVRSTPAVGAELGSSPE